MQIKHKYVTTEWKEAWRLGDGKPHNCVVCNFTMIGENRVLLIKHNHGSEIKLMCDGCANAVAATADGKEVRFDGSAHGAPG